ncbi:MAG: tripartite tricarboxylate transporter substrate binding protein [Hydrogenophaga sp.]|nr:tripartite tricarboxylate transporter substrate binding protein [Hydrogenophaga sp.]
MKLNFQRRTMCLGMVSALCASLGASALASEPDWPTKPVKLVVGYAAGGATDVMARLVAVRMASELGQPVIVDNRAGANSNVGAELVARSPADGYTLYVFTIANTINASLYTKLGYDPVQDFAPIGLIAKIPNLLVVNSALPVHSVQQYIQFARDSKDGITFASSGSGSSIHLSGEMFKMKAGLKMLHVPYRGSAPAVSDLLGGQVQSMFDNSPSAMPHVKAGKLRALAITSKERSPLLPDVPTLAESGFPGFEVQSWFGLAAPAATPAPVIQRVNSALNAALNDPAVKQRLVELVATAAPGTPEDMRAFIGNQLKSWGEVVKAAGVKAD